MPLAALRARRRSRYRERLAGALAGATVLVTGASSGIGRAFALQATAAGATTLLVGRRASELRRLAEAAAPHPGRAVVHAADLSVDSECAALADKVRSDHGAVDVLVNNAGLSIRRPIRQSLDRLEDFDRMLAVNYRMPLQLTLRLLPEMLERRRGHIVNVSTIGVQTGAPNFAAYVASKAALDHFARALRLELGPREIAITTIHMPLVRTPMLAPSKIYDTFPALSAESAAEKIGRAILERPIRVAPRWSSFVETLHAAAPGVVSWAFATLHEPFHARMARRRPRR